MEPAWQRAEFTDYIVQNKLFTLLSFLPSKRRPADFRPETAPPAGGWTALAAKFPLRYAAGRVWFDDSRSGCWGWARRRPVWRLSWSGRSRLNLTPRSSAGIQTGMMNWPSCWRSQPMGCAWPQPSWRAITLSTAGFLRKSPSNNTTSHLKTWRWKDKGLSDLHPVRWRSIRLDEHGRGRELGAAPNTARYRSTGKSSHSSRRLRPAFARLLLSAT